jgi:hypothetical protein
MGGISFDPRSAGRGPMSHLSPFPDFGAVLGDVRSYPRYCCKSRKSDGAENLAKIDSERRYEGRWSFLRETMWSLTSSPAKRINGPKKFRSHPKKTFSTLSANSRLCHYSITSSARASMPGGIVSPSAFAVFMLMTSSNLVGCSIGKFPGLAPLRIRST